MKKAALFAFNGDPMCFVHVLLTALDMHQRGDEVKIVIEGSATRLVPDLGKTDHPLNRLYEKVKGLGLVDGACKACSGKTGVMDAVKAQGLKLLEEMNGHPSMARYGEEGFHIVTF